MTFLRTFFTRNNLLWLAVAGVIAIVSAIAVARTVAAATAADAAPAPTVPVAGPVDVVRPGSATPVATWDRLAQCESSGNWAADTGNGFSGGLQFTRSTWRAYGGQGEAEHAPRAHQITVAERVLADQGWEAWPACSAELGLR